MGAAHQLPLVSRAGAGYQWNASCNGDDGVVSVSITPVTDGFPTGPLPPGASADLMAVIVATAPGRVRVVLECRRPFEADRPPLETHSFAVEVAAADPEA